MEKYMEYIRVKMVLLGKLMLNIKIQDVRELVITFPVDELDIYEWMDGLI